MLDGGRRRARPGWGGWCRLGSRLKGGRWWWWWLVGRVYSWKEGRGETGLQMCLTLWRRIISWKIWPPVLPMKLVVWVRGLY